ncbi:uncharacterized protein LOC121240800 [Juglans microcarpa x Juglans regia]|uniref:uncharacterized protein LOC121240800 n=1 Tax=Juglans microcarpa x Juglans regia TaxID=2249226 RepID=UPI001B7EBFED|nr:uncharacterized protein LOC121240800 [Juglans microcarpa x Juglans regia]
MVAMEEDSLHSHDAIWECPAATDVWAEQDSPVQKWSVGVKSFYQLWEDVHSKLTSENVEKMVIILRNIWRGEDAFQADDNAGINRGRGWKKPEGQLLKVNFDAAIKESTKKSLNFDAAIKESTKKLSLGVIIRDCRREIYAAACLTRESSYGAFGAECTAMWEAMVLCEELGLGEVIFEGDAKSVIDAVSSGEKDDSSYGHLVEILQQKLNFYSRWEVGFIHREGNEVVHQLAKMALCRDNDMYWVEEGPEAITNQLSIDKMYTDFVTS